ncbi:CHASE2 domain-containing protein [Brevundimonas subvibrioides]|uniref:CHASE2 domain-containing protein n=1 Tax=Brevundimonas subvibrioides TaxID=74313 RepID=UPI0022B31795|nr:CHASE2 domain-containing protein [Brevundimonas subvibrioides]
MKLPTPKTMIEVAKVAATGVLAGGFAILAINLLPQFVKIEHSITDLRTVAFSDRAPQTSLDVAIVGIDEKSLEGVPYLSPLDRGYLSDVVTEIAGAEPRVIVLDILFDRTTEPKKDEALEQTLRNLQVPVVLIRSGDPLDPAFQNRFLASTYRPIGGPLVSATVDDVVRHIPVSPDGTCSLSEAAKLVRDNPGLRTLPHCDRERPIRIDWLLEPPGQETFTYIRSSELTGPDVMPLQLARLRGKVVIIGGVFDLIDRHKTPLSVLHGDTAGVPGTQSSLSNGATSPGVLVHAQAMQQLFDGRVRHELGVIGEAILLLFCGLSGAILGSFSEMRKRRGIVLFVVTISLIVIDITLFKFARFVLPGDAAGFAVFLGFLFNSMRLNYRIGGLPSAGKTLGETIL